MRPFVAPLAPFLLALSFAQDVEAQTRRHVISGTVSANNSSGMFASVSSGDAVTLTLDVDTTSVPTVLGPGVVEYSNPLVRGKLEIGGIVIEEFDPPSRIDIVNDEEEIDTVNYLFSCTDEFDLLWFSDPAQSTPLVLLSETAADFVTNQLLLLCPSNLSSTDIPDSFVDIGPAGGLFRIFDQGFVSIANTSETSFLIAPNDRCADAIAVSEGPTVFNAVGAETDGGDYLAFCDTGSGDGLVHGDIWFRYSPNANACVNITTGLLSPAFDTRLAVYDGASCPEDPATILACSDSTTNMFGGTIPATIDLDVEIGRTYLIRLGSMMPGAIMGTGILDIGPATGVASPGAPGCSPFLDRCTGDGGDQMGCTDCPCANNAAPGAIGGCLNSASTPARLLASGSPSLSAGNLCFEMSGGVPQSFAILTSGSGIAPGNAANPCFAQNPGSGITSVLLDGLRCRIGSVFRHGSRGIDAAGFVGPMGPPPNGAWGFCAANFPNFAFAAGDTRTFQVFYREEQTAGCMTGLNTSQAVEIALLP